MYYLLVDKIGKSGIEVYKGKLNDNIDKVINTYQYYIVMLENLRAKLDLNVS